MAMLLHQYGAPKNGQIHGGITKMVWWNTSYATRAHTLCMHCASFVPALAHMQSAYSVCRAWVTFGELCDCAWWRTSLCTWVVNRLCTGHDHAATCEILQRTYVRRTAYLIFNNLRSTCLCMAHILPFINTTCNLSFNSFLLNYWTGFLITFC